MKRETELWVLRGKWPVLWTIPFYATKREGEYEVFSAIPMPLHSMQYATDTLLASVGRNVNGIHFVPYDAWKANAHLCTSKNPEDAFSWGKLEEAQKPTFLKKEREGMTEFLDALHQKGIGATRGEVAFWWIQFCNHAFDWMINRNKSVDFFLFTLHPTVFRPDWKEALVQSYLNTSELRRRIKKFYFDKFLLNDPVFHERATSPKLFVLNKELKPRRYLELEHSRHWSAKISEIEEERFRDYTAGEYAEDFVGKARAQLPTTAKLFAWWLTFRRLPHTEILRDRNGRAIRFAARKAHSRKRERKNRKRTLLNRLRRAVHDADSAKAKAVKLESALAAPRPLPSLRTLERQVNKLRYGRPDVPEPEENWAI